MSIKYLQVSANTRQQEMSWPSETCHILRDGNACNVGNNSVEAYWTVVVVESNKGDLVSLFEGFIAKRSCHNICIAKKLRIIFNYCKIMSRM